MAEKTNILNIDEFVQNSFLSKKGFLKPNTFKIIITIPNLLKLALISTSKYIQETLTWNAISISSPGFSITDNDSQFPFRTKLVQRTQDNISIQFYESNNQEMNKIFYEWMNLMIELKSNAERIIRNYQKDYIGKLVIYNVKEESPTTYHHHQEVFEGVYPISAGAINYDTGDENTFVKYPVTFRYRYHKIN